MSCTVLGKFLIAMFSVFLLITISSTNIAKNITTSSLLISDIVIPDDYPTIQDGIDNANPGDQIFVKSGIYKENIVIDKEHITLRGEDKLTTTIDGGKQSKNTVTITAQGVTIQDFSIINGQNNGGGSWDTAGIRISASDVVIRDNLVMWNLLGINVLDIAHNLTIIDNSFIEDGILLGNYEYTTNMFTKDSFIHTIEGNTVNGKPLYYYKNMEDFTVPIDAGQVLLANCTNVIVKDMFFTKDDFPVSFGFCSYCTIENITVDDTWGEIILLQSDNCTIQNNTASNVIYGICLDYKSDDNIVRYNEVMDCTGGVVVMTRSKNNNVYGNYVHHNVIGIFLLNRSSHNNITQNIITDNTIGVKLQLNPCCNKITENKFKMNILSAVSIGKTKNYWNQNYWNRPRILPKMIFTYRSFGKMFHSYFEIPIPYFVTGADWHPSLI